eukprot:gb/GEZN01020278.1/.p1 GENE.gb/GEZN01020278.1/~~gb/GEZN01020278.1/.p1  ORF type:complete len:117 (-),score=18.34 gb/GEZN01020278.1/:130-480(-)
MEPYSSSSVSSSSSKKRSKVLLVSCLFGSNFSSSDSSRVAKATPSKNALSSSEPGLKNVLATRSQSGPLTSPDAFMTSLLPFCTDGPGGIVEEAVEVVEVEEEEEVYRPRCSSCST